MTSIGRTLPLLVPPVLLLAAAVFLLTSLLTDHWVTYDLRDEHAGIFDIDTSDSIEVVRVLLFFVIITYAVSFVVKLHFVLTHRKGTSSGSKDHAHRYLGLCTVSAILDIAAIGLFVNIKNNLPEPCSFGYSFHLAWGSAVCVFVGGAYHFLRTTCGSRRSVRRRVPSEVPRPVFNIQQHMNSPNPATNGNNMVVHAMNEAVMMNNLSLVNYCTDVASDPSRMDFAMSNQILMLNSSLNNPNSTMNNPNVNTTSVTTNQGARNQDAMGNQTMSNPIRMNNPIMMNSPNRIIIPDMNTINQGMNNSSMNNRNVTNSQGMNNSSMNNRNVTNNQGMNIPDMNTNNQGMNNSNTTTNNQNTMNRNMNNFSQTSNLNMNDQYTMNQFMNNPIMMNRILNNPNIMPHLIHHVLMNYPLMMNIRDMRNAPHMMGQPPSYHENSNVNYSNSGSNPPAYGESPNNAEQPGSTEQTNGIEQSNRTEQQERPEQSDIAEQLVRPDQSNSSEKSNYNDDINEPLHETRREREESLAPNDTNTITSTNL